MVDGVGCVEAGVVDAFGCIKMGVMVMMEVMMVVEGSRGIVVLSGGLCICQIYIF